MGHHATEHLQQDQTELALLASLRDGDAAGIAKLFDRYAPALLGVISRIVTDRKKAEDLLQAAFIRMRFEIHTFDASKARLFTWMLGIARKIALESTGSSPAAEIREAGKSVSNTAALDLVYLNGYDLTRAAKALGLSEEDLKKKIRMELTNLRASHE